MYTPQPPVLTPADLATVTAFAGLPDNTLAWLLAHGEARAYPDGATLIEPGSSADFLLALVRGSVQFYQLRGNQREPIFRVEPGQVTGVLPYSRLRVSTGLGLAVGETVVYRLHRDLFPVLEQASPELVQRLVAIMNYRSRDQVRGQERDDKLRALGKLSAGLAHELNNPAAAIARAAQSLGSCVAACPQLLLELMRHCPGPDALAGLVALAERPVAPVLSVSALERSDQEDALASWLEEQGVTTGYEIAPNLYEARLTAEVLAPVVAQWPSGRWPPGCPWLAGRTTHCRAAHSRCAGRRCAHQQAG